MAKLRKTERQIWRAIDQIQNRFERELLTNYKEALDKIRVDLQKIFDKYSVNGKLTNAEMTKFNRLTKLNDQLTETMGPVFSKNGRLVERLSEVEYQEAFYRYGWAIQQDAQVALKWGLLNDETVKAAVANDLRHIAKTGMRQNGLLGIRRAVTQGVIQGQSYTKMAKEIKRFIDRSASGYIRIARTEGQRAAVLGQLAAADESEELGVEIKRIWDATLDMATRPEHGDLDGKAAGKDGMFNTSVGPVAGPTLSGVASFDINCRCRVREEVTGFEPKIRRIRDEGLKPYETYKSWAKRNGIKKNKYGAKLK